MWLKGPRVVSVAWLNVIFSTCHILKKTSLFVKSPQEQNVPLLQERVTSPSAGVCLCVFMVVSVCRSLLGGWSQWHLCCHWAAWLVSYVITRAWLHTDMTKNALEYTAAFKFLY